MSSWPLVVLALGVAALGVAPLGMTACASRSSSAPEPIGTTREGSCACCGTVVDFGPGETCAAVCAGVCDAGMDSNG